MVMVVDVAMVAAATAAVVALSATRTVYQSSASTAFNRWAKRQKWHALGSPHSDKSTNPPMQPCIQTIKCNQGGAGCTALAERLRHLDGSDVHARVCHIHTTSCVERTLIVQPPCGRAWVRVHRQRARQWDFWCRVLCVLITTHHSTG
jgi:hypothetical protein